MYGLGQTTEERLQQVSEQLKRIEQKRKDCKVSDEQFRDISLECADVGSDNVLSCVESKLCPPDKKALIIVGVLIIGLGGYFLLRKK